MAILCGTDFTPRAAEAAEVAAAVAVRAGETLLLVHALDEHGGTGPASKKLHAEAERLRQLFSGLEVNTRLESGFADEVLAGLARSGAAADTPGRQGVRLIVVSSLGRRDPSRWALGSVAERTAQLSPVPVLIVRDEVLLLEALRGERRLRVVVGFDFSATSAAALRWVSEICRVVPCDVVVGHVTQPAAERKRQRAGRPVGAFESFPQLEVLLKSDLGARVREQVWTDGSPGIRIKLSTGARANALAELAAEEKADLLVAGSCPLHGSGRTWQESVSRGALYHAAMSVACVPTTAAAERAKPSSAEPAGDEDELELARKLEAHPLLRGAPGEVLRRIAAISREESFAPGTVLLREGAEADTLFLLSSGFVVLELNVPGTGEVRLESLRDGDIIGFSWLVHPYRWHLDARVIEPSSILAIDAPRLREWMEEDAEVGQAVAMRLVSQLYERLERLRMQQLDLYRVEP